MKQDAIPQEESLTQEALEHWAQAFGYVATRYRVACSPGALVASAPWLQGKSKTPALTGLAREAGLTFHLLNNDHTAISSWRLPVVVELKEGKIGVIEHFDGEETLEICFFDGKPHTNRLSLAALLPAIEQVVALRPLAALKDSRVDAYISKYRPDWLYRLVMRDLRPYAYVMLAALFVNVLSLAGIIFSMQVYDRVIPAQSYPTLYVLTIGVLIATLFGFILRLARSHIMDLLGKRADLRVSDRVFGHALRLRNSAIPRSTGSFISQLRELEQIREMVIIS
jgi:ATP-binding cassette subfamily C protein LapB